jgi:hypothetical protein
VASLLPRLLLVAVACLLATCAGAAAQDSSGTSDGAGLVTVTTDAMRYAPGDAVTATATNGSPQSIAPQGGIVCQGSPWPFGVQQQADDGSWQDIVLPRTPPCIGIAVRQLGPGESQSKTLSASADPGTYRLTYTYSAADGSQAVAVSDPFTVATP